MGYKVLSQLVQIEPVKATLFLSLLSIVLLLLYDGYHQAKFAPLYDAEEDVNQEAFLDQVKESRASYLCSSIDTFSGYIKALKQEGLHRIPFKTIDFYMETKKPIMVTSLETL